MTTLSIDARDRAPLWPVFLTLLLLAVAVAASAHALSKHAEASAVMHGCNRGPHSAWQVRGHPNDYWLLCQTDEGNYGVAKLKCTKQGWRNQTAFVPAASQHAGGSLARAIEYLSARSTIVQGGIETACQ